MNQASRRVVFRSFLVALILFCATATVFSQVDSAVLTGTIKDSNNATIQCSRLNQKHIDKPVA